jgi:hypothetical protein
LRRVENAKKRSEPSITALPMVKKGSRTKKLL